MTQVYSQSQGCQQMSQTTGVGQLQSRALGPAETDVLRVPFGEGCGTCEYVCTCECVYMHVFLVYESFTSEHKAFPTPAQGLQGRKVPVKWLGSQKSRGFNPSSGRLGGRHRVAISIQYLGLALPPHPWGSAYSLHRGNWVKSLGRG